MTVLKRLSITQIFKNSVHEVRCRWKAMVAFVLAHAVFACVLAALSRDNNNVAAFSYRKDYALGVWGVLYYSYWYFFFRFYFGRKPYFAVTKLFATLVPFTKMLFMASLLAVVLYALPLIIPFMGIGQDWAARYEIYLKTYLEDTDILDWATLAVLVLSLPMVFLRPVMAWIAAIAGRSGAMASAFARTDGNYGKFVLVGLAFCWLPAAIGAMGNGENPVCWLWAVPVSAAAVFLGVILAKIYEFFFLEID